MSPNTSQAKNGFIPTFIVSIQKSNFLESIRSTQMVSYAWWLSMDARVHGGAGRSRQTFESPAVSLNPSPSTAVGGGGKVDTYIRHSWTHWPTDSYPHLIPFPTHKFSSSFSLKYPPYSSLSDDIGLGVNYCFPLDFLYHTGVPTP